MATVESMSVIEEEQPDPAREGLSLDLSSRPCWVVCIARAGSGKSVLVRSIMHSAAKQGVYKHIICFTQTGKCLNDEYKWLPDHAVRECKDVEQVFEIFDKLKRWKRANPTKQIEPWALVLDDIYSQASSKLVYNPRWSHIVACFRHYSCSIFISVQFWSAISPHMRSAVDYLAVFQTRSKAAIQGLYAICDAHFDSKRDFMRLLQESTKKKHHCMFYDARAPDRESAFRSFVATPPPDFKLKFEPCGL